MKEDNTTPVAALSEEDRKRIKEWVGEIYYNTSPHTDNWNQLTGIAERATKYERSAAQARIAELEGALKEEYAKGWNDALKSAITTAHAYSSGCAAMEIEQQLQKKRIKRKKP